VEGGGKIKKKGAKNDHANVDPTGNHPREGSSLNNICKLKKSSRKPGDKCKHSIQVKDGAGGKTDRTDTQHFQKNPKGNSRGLKKKEGWRRGTDYRSPTRI